MLRASNKFSGGKWHEKYMPFVAKSPEMQIGWLLYHLERLKKAGVREKKGILSSYEISPYIKLLLEPASKVEGGGGAAGTNNKLTELLAMFGEDEMLLMIECADIYDIPKLFGLLSEVTPRQAIMALKKEPPRYEKKPLLIIDRVFHAIREKSTELLENAAQGVLASEDAPADFAANYQRFREIMMDEKILSLLYPKAR